MGAPVAAPNEMKIAVIGSGGVGKSALTLLFVEDDFVSEYDPTIEDTFHKQFMVDNEGVFLEILDTAGQEEHSTTRAQYLMSCQGFIAVYAVNSRASYEEVKMLCKQMQVLKDSTTVPMILVGNKIDLKDDRKVSPEEARAFAASLKAGYMEISVKGNINGTLPFDEIVRRIRVRQRADAAAAAQPPMSIPVSVGGPTGVAGPHHTHHSNEGLLAMFAYLFSWLSGVFALLIAKDSPYVRFHGAQSIALFIVFLPFLIVAIIIDVVIRATTPRFFISVAVLIAWIFYLAVIIYCMVRAYRGNMQNCYRMRGVCKLADLMLPNQEKPAQAATPATPPQPQPSA